MRGRVPRVGDGDMADADSDEAAYAASDALTHAALRATYARLLPALAAARPLEHAWTGVMCATDDGSPLLGEVEPRVWVCGGFNGHGMPRAFGAARAVVRVVLRATGRATDSLPDTWSKSAAAEEERMLAWDVRRLSRE